jgi:hypothetical protein
MLPTDKMRNVRSWDYIVSVLFFNKKINFKLIIVVESTPVFIALRMGFSSLMGKANPTVGFPSMQTV